MAGIKPAGGGGEIFPVGNEPEQRSRSTLHNMVATGLREPNTGATEGY